MLLEEMRGARVGISYSFVSWVAERGLIDLGFPGQKVTWNHRGGHEMFSLS